MIQIGPPFWFTGRLAGPGSGAGVSEWGLIPMKSSDSLRTFAGAVAIVTGGASGIGRALGEALARRGARVILADLQADLAEDVAAGIREGGGRATAEGLDVTDFAATNRLVLDTVRDAGRLDYVFNVAGIGIVGEARYYELDDWYRILDINVRGVVHGVQAAYPIMLGQGFGHIVNMASGAGLWPSPFVVGYCTTKHAVVGLSTSLRIEAAAAGVRVSVLCPGAVRTPALTCDSKYGKVLPPIPPDVLRKLVERQRPMRPEHFAEQALRHVAKNRAIIVIPSWWKIVWWLNRLSPGLGLYLGRKSMEIATRTVERPTPDAALEGGRNRHGTDRTR
jgi:NAD(P)-dependent dehydrogenase (short-subunit alcohol dehydrogenase family)